MVATVETSTELEFLLRKIAELVQLPPTLEEKVRTSYEALTGHLEESDLTKFDPVLYAQGSYLIGTTVRPKGRDEFDLDFVVQLAIASSADPASVYELVARTIEANGNYAGKVERNNRCVRVNYAGDYHLDVVPGIPNPALSGTAILIPARDAMEWAWQESDPKAWAHWFMGSAATPLGTRAAAVEPLPPPRNAEHKSPLQITVQLVKRYQNEHVEDEESRTPSITLSTIAGSTVTTQRTITETMGVVVNAIARYGLQAAPVEVANPVKPDEDLGRKWSDVRVFTEFQAWSRQLAEDWLALSSGAVTGFDRVQHSLSSMFGEGPVDKAFEALGERARRAQTSGKLVTGTTAGTLGIGVAGQVNRPHTHYGDG